MWIRNKKNPKARRKGDRIPIFNKQETIQDFLHKEKKNYSRRCINKRSYDVISSIIIQIWRNRFFTFCIFVIVNYWRSFQEPKLFDVCGLRFYLFRSRVLPNMVDSKILKTFTMKQMWPSSLPVEASCTIISQVGHYDLITLKRNNKRTKKQTNNEKRNATQSNAKKRWPK